LKQAVTAVCDDLVSSRRADQLGRLSPWPPVNLTFGG
jgi:hypothetical protein